MKIAYENDILDIPKNYKDMSVSELKIEKDKMFAEITKHRTTKPSKSTLIKNYINFSF